MIIFLCIYLIIGIIITSAVFYTIALDVSSEKLNSNKYDILALKILMGAGFIVAYPIVILLIMLGRDDG